MRGVMARKTEPKRRGDFVLWELRAQGQDDLGHPEDWRDVDVALRPLG